MLKLQTKYFGEIEYEQGDLIHFPAGLFGFEEERDFLILPFEGGNGNLLCMQSAATPALAFVVLNPLSLLPGYTPVLQPVELCQFEVDDVQELGYYVLCAVKNPVSASTVNLKCPVVVNPTTRIARQVIMDTEQYGMRHPLTEFGREEAGVC